MDKSKKYSQKQKDRGYPNAKVIGWKEQIKDFLSIILSVVAIVISIYTYIESRDLQVKYDRINTYNTDLSYQITISDEMGREGVAIVDGQIQVKKKVDVKISPKLGGIQKIYMIYYENGNIVALLPIEIFTKEVVATLDAQDGSYDLTEYNLDILGEDENSYYSSVFFLIEDYNHNFFTNMIIYKIDKEDISKIVARIYNEVDLLHAYNEGILNLPDFDRAQIKEYLSLKVKLDEIL